MYNIGIVHSLSFEKLKVVVEVIIKKKKKIKK